MAKEIVIQQTKESEIYLLCHRPLMDKIIIGSSHDGVFVEHANVPLLISALCELSGVSGVPTGEDVDKVFPMTFYDGTLTLDDKLFDVKRRAVKMFLSEYIAPLVARIQAEKQALLESNDNLNEANKQLSMDVHLLQAENQRLLKDGRIKTKAENVRLKAENEELKKRCQK